MNRILDCIVPVWVPFQFIPKWMLWVTTVHKWGLFSLPLPVMLICYSFIPIHHWPYSSDRSGSRVYFLAVVILFPKITQILCCVGGTLGETGGWFLPRFLCPILNAPDSDQHDGLIRQHKMVKTTTGSCKDKNAKISLDEMVAIKQMCIPKQIDFTWMTDAVFPNKPQNAWKQWSDESLQYFLLSYHSLDFS